MSDNKPERVKILEEAAELLVGQRQEDYGTPEENFKRIAAYWSIRLSDYLKINVELEERIVAEMMALLKIARTANSPTRDTYLDLAGYAGIAAELSSIESKDESHRKKTLYTGENSKRLLKPVDELSTGDIWAVDISDPTTWWVWTGFDWDRVPTNNISTTGDSK